MFQPNVPMLWQELQEQSYNSMEKIVIRGSTYSVIAYILGGAFGYLTFADRAYKELQAPERSSNILEADYGED